MFSNLLTRLLLVSAILVALGGCGETLSTHDPLRMGLANAPVNLDPRSATDAASARINRLLYRRLVAFDATDRPVPDLADWQRISPVHYRFRLLPDQRADFSHGRALSSSDIKATLESILDPDTGSPFRQQIALIERIRVNGADQVDFFLRHADPLFPALLALEILPADLIAAGHPFHREPVGNGPFELTGWPAPGQLRLRRRTDGQVIELVEVKNPGVRVMKLLRGEIDLLQGDLSPELFNFLRERDAVSVDRRAGGNLTYIGLNLRDSRLKDPRIRRALALAIDRDAIIKYVMGGAAIAAHALLPPWHWAGLKNPAEFHRDLPRARELLGQAGYDPRRPLELEYKTSTDPFRVRLATILQAQLAQAGIQVKVRSLDWGTFFGDIKAGRFQLYSLTWVGIKTPDHFRYVFHSASIPPVGANRGRYQNPRADRLIERAEGTPTLERQAQRYQELQQLLLADLPYIPLWFEDQRMAARRGIDGYTLAADGNYDGLGQLRREATNGAEP